MSTSLWIAVFVVLALCIFIFKKTISSDAENDFKIRDILSSRDSVPNESINKMAQPEHAHQPSEADYTETQKNLYEEIAESQKQEQYKTETHNDYHTEYSKSFGTKTSDDNTLDNAAYDKNFKHKSTPEAYVKRLGFCDFLRIFWRGITFTIGSLACLYSLYGLVSFVQTSNDAVIYSIWLLIGVILIK